MKCYALHGNLGTVRDWDLVEAAWGNRLIALDLWEDMAPLAEWAAARLEEMEPGGILLGYSLGARLAMHLLRAAPPQFFHAVVLLSGHPGLAEGAARTARLAGDETWAQKVRNLPWEDFLAAWEAQAVFQQTAARPLATSLSVKHRESVAQAFTFWSLGQQQDLRPFLCDAARLPRHRYWMTGREDAKFSALAADVCPPWQHISVAGGHRLPWDAPEAVAKVLEACGSFS